ncbi:hypothetical protein BX616_009438, partial [Lobosporangium transversale]
MGSLFSKQSKTQKPKDPKWQGIGPNTPLPNSPSSNQDNQSRSHTLATLDSRMNNNNTRPTKPAPAKGKSSKIMLLLKMDPKSGGQRKVISKNLISLPSDFR